MTTNISHGLKAEMGELQAIKPTKSMWYLHYVDSPILDDSTLLPKFCKWF